MIDDELVELIVERYEALLEYTNRCMVAADEPSER